MLKYFVHWEQYLKMKGHVMQQKLGIDMTLRKVHKCLPSLKQQSQLRIVYVMSLPVWQRRTLQTYYCNWKKNDNGNFVILILLQS
mgnify:CR=1 FL=1